MLAMQYTISLPVDFNPSLIRERVAQRAGLFENRAGLVHKSFLFNEQDALYAPFYVWDSDTCARNFLLDDLFKGVINSFTRPRVRSWTVIASANGKSRASSGFAMREAESIPGEECLQELAEREREKQQKLLQEPGLCYHAVALDPDRWELLRFTVWTDKASSTKPEADCVQSYEVLHVTERK